MANFLRDIQMFTMATILSEHVQEEDIWIKIFSSLHPLNNIKVTNYFKYEPRFNHTFSRNNLHKIKDGAYAINFDDKNSKRTH